MPEERRQTAGGVERDLRRCLANWLGGIARDEFTRGKRARPERY